MARAGERYASARENPRASRRPRAVLGPTGRAMPQDPDDPDLDALDPLDDAPSPPDDEAAPEARVRKPRPLDPAIVALFPEALAVDHEFIAGAQRAWREATQREAPSIERLAERGTIQRIDADLSSGYLAVVTADDTWWAFVPQPVLPAVLALMLRTPQREITEALAAGPGTLKPRAAAPS